MQTSCQTSGYWTGLLQMYVSQNALTMETCACMLKPRFLKLELDSRNLCSNPVQCNFESYICIQRKLVSLVQNKNIPYK